MAPRHSSSSCVAPMAFVAATPLGAAPRPSAARAVSRRRVGTPAVAPPPPPSRAVAMSAPTPTPSSSSAEASSPTSSSSSSSKDAASSSRSYEGAPPGKMVLNEIRLAEQKKALNALGDRWEAERKELEQREKRIFGWVPGAERLNGRLAMFFFFTGLLTEYWTGDTIPQQVELLARTLGLI